METILEIKSEASYTADAHLRNRNEGEITMPWLVQSSVSGNVSQDYEPDIRSIDMAHHDIELFRIGAAIGHRKLSETEIERVPEFLVVGKNSRGDVPAILGMSVGPFIVNQKVRDVLEELEPDVQQFHPITVKAKDGKPIKGNATLPYFILMYPPPLECIDINKTEWGPLGLGAEAFAKYGRLGSIVTLRKSVIKGHHFWRWKGPEGTGWEFFASDELKIKLKEQGLKGWHFATKCEVS